MMGLPQLAQEEIPQSAFALLMGKIASVLSMLLLAGGTLFLAYLLLRQAYRLCRYAAKRLKQYVSAAATEYDDEITDTREDGAARESRFTRRVRRHTAFDATPAGRIRQAYARLLRRRSSWAESSTARENLPEDALTWLCNAQVMLEYSPDEAQHYTVCAFSLSDAYLDGMIYEWQAVENTEYEYSVAP